MNWQAPITPEEYAAMWALVSEFADAIADGPPPHKPEPDPEPEPEEP